MKRDMELIRKILIQLEEDFEPEVGIRDSLTIEGYSNNIIGAHCELLHQAGLVSEFKPNRGGQGNKLISFCIGPLSNRGHDYLELIRNESTWEETKKEIEKKSLPNTIQTIGQIAASIAGAFMREYTK